MNHFKMLNLKWIQKIMVREHNTIKSMKRDNKQLLSELEMTYKSLEEVLEQTSKEKEITYQELQDNFNALEQSYQELSKKENLLVHLEKLSSIGQFITEIIHELKNPITVIAAHTEMAFMMEPAEEIKEQLQQISIQIGQMSDYLNRFRNMAYKGQENFIVFDLNQNLYECLSVLEIIHPRDVKVEVDFCDENLLISGDQYQTNQIFLNLAKNAFDAIKTHGDLLQVRSRLVTTEWIVEEKKIADNFCLSEKEWQKILTEVDEFALIEFEDNGAGISSENIADLFDAFFTTKKSSKGLGLGLSISTDIAKRHKANIAVKSETGLGTTFQVLFPLVDKTDEDIMMMEESDETMP